MKFSECLYLCIDLYNTLHSIAQSALQQNVLQSEAVSSMGVSTVPPSAVLMKGFLTVARPARHSAAQNTQSVTQRCGTENWEEHHTGLGDQSLSSTVCVNIKHREQTESKQA